MRAAQEDPRVTRTREKVLEVVRTILDTDGPMGVSYSAVAKAAGVGRQTVYNHWSTPEQMIRDAAVEGYDGGYPTDVVSAEDAIAQWLHSLSGALKERRRVAGLASLIAVAPYGAQGDAALRELVADRVAAFNEVLAPLSLTCSADTYARIVGPLHYKYLIAREPVTDEMIDRIASTLAPELTPA